jgi:hypothetical protein
MARGLKRRIGHGAGTNARGRITGAEADGHRDGVSRECISGML